MAVGDDRQHGGNAGYDDRVDTYYTWDNTVNNHANLKVGDPIVLWDKKRLLGVSVIEEIKVSTDTKLVFRCPNPDCGRASIKERKTRSPRFRCNQCSSEFEVPKSESVVVTRYQSRHDAAWTSLEDLLSGAELRDLAESPRSQLSMRPLDWARFTTAVAERGKESAVETVLRRALSEATSEVNLGKRLSSHGHTLATVRVRRGQQAFRENLLQTFGEVCAFTGEAPSRVLDAGHLYSYAELGEHHEHGGLLLRRDIHRLFDDGSLAINPSNLEIDISDALGPYPQYASLRKQHLKVRVNEQQTEWLQKHWSQYRL